MTKQWKFLRYDGKRLTSSHDNSLWTIGEWREIGPVKQICIGLNSCNLIQFALSYVNGEALAEVECDGSAKHINNKSTWQRQRIVKVWAWDKTASVRLSVFAAKQSLPIYEKEYPNDNRVRLAIEAAEAWLQEDTDAARSAACSAADAASSAANAASSAANAARSAAWSAADAASSAAYAACSAAYAACSAADAASSAANAASSAARSAARQKIHDYIVSDIIPALKPIKPKLWVEKAGDK